MSIENSELLLYKTCFYSSNYLDSRAVVHNDTILYC
ncbi:hypothetical protein XF24_00672 [candidate division SR1 bacterium Aalborg_AAW-1]|nr:hypothetical protein XF24_00672 [candidate division SR1 bacterium Aalborg_AAW-1]